jgi:hypothetical protein
MEHLAAAELLDLVGALGADGNLTPHPLSGGRWPAEEGAVSGRGRQRYHGFAVSELKGTSKI